MRYVIALTALGLSSTALAQDCLSAYDPDSPRPRVDFYNCLDESVSDNRAAIETNAAGIAYNTLNLDFLNLGVDFNAIGIGENRELIDANIGAIDANGAAIGANAGDIATNARGIEANALASDTNARDISANATLIGANADNIGTNAGNIATNAENIASNTSSIEDLAGRVAALEEEGGGDIAMWYSASAGYSRGAPDVRIDAADVLVDTLTVFSSATYDHQLFISGSLTGASGDDGCNTHCWLYIDGSQVAFVDDHDENCSWTYMTWAYTTPSVYPAGEHEITMLCDNQAGDWTVLGEHSHNQVMTIPQ